MDFFVYSRSAIEAVAPHDEPHVIVSITTTTADQARLRTGPPCRGVLRLSFADADVVTGFVTEADLFSDVHARQIWDFVLAHRDGISRILVHCDAGFSRSPAVAAALARGLGQDDADFFKRYRPNMRVYRTLLNAAPSAP